MAELTRLAASQLLDGYRRRTISPVEVVDALAVTIERHNESLTALYTVCLDRARDEARAAEAAYSRGEAVGSLAGVPFVVKDLFDTQGVRTTYGSPMFADHVPDRDAAAVRAVRDAGGILIGKAQTHEFAWGISSVNFLMGSAHNPWAPERMSGGSSGGSAVALATGMAPLALGSDTGGSIRVPSNFCGTVGLKPTYGRTSTEGVFPLAASLDHVGPMARTPADAALLFAALTAAPGHSGLLSSSLSGLRVGVSPDMHVVELAGEVDAAYQAAVSAVGDLGADIVEVAMPEAQTAYETFGVVQRCEALASHQQAGLFPARLEEYGEDVRGRLELAQTMTLADYLGGIASRERLRAGLHRAFSEVDLILTPVSAGSPAVIGDERVEHRGREIDFRELVMGYTVPQDLSGLPTCAVRAGFDALGIPVAVQFTGPAWSEWRVLSAAHALYGATPDVQAPWPPLVEAAGASRS
jgi:aspartyl-tRNA(Asn)/glutamyl-tRNA(Gln) amidotransferase subunit A